MSFIPNWTFSHVVMLKSEWSNLFSWYFLFCKVCMVKVKIKLPPLGMPLRHMEDGDTAPLICNLSTRLAWVVSFLPWPLYSQGKNRWYLLNRRLGGSQIQSRHLEEVLRLLPLLGVKLPFLRCPVCSQVTILTGRSVVKSLYWLAGPVSCFSHFVR
jgi:hypothetical protein